MYISISSLTGRINASKIGEILFYTFLLPLPNSHKNSTEVHERQERADSQ